MGWRIKDDCLDYLDYKSLPTFYEANDNPLEDFDSLETCIKTFFNNPTIKDLVEENNWVKIIGCWRSDYKGDTNYGNDGWRTYLLIEWLLLAGIDFQNYLPSKYKMDASNLTLLNDYLYWEK